MRSTTTFTASVIVAMTLLAATRAPAADASPSSEPVPTPTLALSTKPPLGCCCIADAADARRRHCSDSLSEAKCQVAARVLPGRVGTWTVGRCPGS